MDLIARIALFLILLSTGGFIVYLLKKSESVFRYSYWILFSGFVFHTIFFIHQYFALGVMPVINLKLSLSFLAWCITGIYLLFQIKFRLMVLGSFVAPLAAFLMILSSTVTGAQEAVPPVLKSLWLIIHVFSIFLGDGMFAIAFISAIMYLIQERQIKNKTRGTLFKRLPSLETLDTINYHSLIYGFPLLTFGMITGAVYAQRALGAYWRWDPKEVWSLVTWLAYAILLHERLAVGWRGRRAAYMSILCFIILILTFFGSSMWLNSYHSFSGFGKVPRLP